MVARPSSLLDKTRKKLELTSFPMQEIYDRFGKISTGGSSYRNNTITKCVGKGVRQFKAPFPIGSSTFQVYRLTLVLDLRLCRCSNYAA